VTDVLALFEMAREDAEDVELRRIEFHKQHNTATWDDHRRAAEIKRRQVDREFRRRESERADRRGER